MKTEQCALIIDENGDSRLCLKRTLVRLGCTVIDVDSTENGIGCLRQTPFLFVFASLCVRSIGARGVARWVKTNCEKTHFFLITSWKGELEESILESDGIECVIHRPLMINEIRAAVGKYLE